MPAGEIDQVTAAEELDDRPPQQIAGYQDRDQSKCKGYRQPITQRLRLLPLRRATRDDRQYERIVDGKRPFHHEQRPHGADVLRIEGLAEEHWRKSRDVETKRRRDAVGEPLPHTSSLCLYVSSSLPVHVPKIRSPASPSPGMIYPCSLSCR